MSPIFYISNILDYCRIVLLIIAISVWAQKPWLAVGLYIINSVLDMLDGSIARWLNQQSKLGALLDFSIDRAGITILFAACIDQFPHLWSLFVAMMALDIASHFAVCYAKVDQAGTHLSFIAQGSHLIKSFAQTSWVRYIICTSHDAFFALFVGYALCPSIYFIVIGVVLLPGALLKVWIHLEQFYLATKFVAKQL